MGILRSYRANKKYIGFVSHNDDFYRYSLPVKAERDFRENGANEVRV
jgi:hypothetical protein